MLSAILLSGFLGLTGDVGGVDLAGLLASSSREELQIVDRIRTIRTATEKLPDTWKSTNPQGQTLTKGALIAEIETMELAAAERWTVLIENAALIDRPIAADRQTIDLRRDLEKLSAFHSEQNRRLDEFNARMKDGILLNLASKFLAH